MQPGSSPGIKYAVHRQLVTAIQRLDYAREKSVRVIALTAFIRSVALSLGISRRSAEGPISSWLPMPAGLPYRGESSGTVLATRSALIGSNRPAPRPEPL